MNEHHKSLAFIHISVFLFGFSALFARLVNQPAIIITFGRVFFSSIFLFALIYINGSRTFRRGLNGPGSENRRFPSRLILNSKKDYSLIVLSGVILGIHWFCFFLSIQMASVAIGTITFSTFPVFLAFLEPLVFKEKLKLRPVVCSVIMLTGIFLIAAIRKEQSSTGITPGIFIGLVSGLTYAILSLFNRNFSGKYKSEVIVFYEQLTAAIILLPFVFILRPVISSRDIVLLSILGIVFTAIAHGLFVNGLRHVKAGKAGIISGLETVYATVLASLLLKEIPSINEIAGGLVIIISAGYMTLYRENKNT